MGADVAPHTAPGVNSWPMVLVNFVTFHTTEFQDCTKATGLLDYLYWTQTNAEAGAMATAYVFYHSSAPLIDPSSY